MRLSEEIMTTLTAERVLSTGEPARIDSYKIEQFTEANNPWLTEEAWRVHAEGYVDSGFVKPEAVLADGTLPTDIDKSRGDNIDYFLATNAEKPSDRATMRRVSLSPGQSYRDLPAYKLCAGSISPDGEAILAAIPDQARTLKEIAGLAKVRGANPLGIFELLRNGFQESVPGEVWFFGVVSTTLDSLKRQLGEDNFTILGEEVRFKDDRINESVALTPALIGGDKLLDNIMASYYKADSRNQLRLLRNFMFFSAGLKREQMSEEAFGFKQFILRQMAARTATQAVEE